MSINVVFDISPYKEKLIDIFTKFYGEHNRAFVEKKFSKITFLNTYDFQSLMLYESDADKKKELFDYEEKIVHLLQDKLKAEFPTLPEKFLYENDLFTDGLIEFFEIETNGEYHNNKKIEYFKTIGIDLGDNYEDYLHSDLAQSKVPPFALINKIKELKQHLIRDYDLITNHTNSSYFSLNSYLRDNNLDDQIPPHKIMQYIIDGDPMTITVLQNNTLNLLILMNFINDSFKDRGLFHEINHCMSFLILHIGKKKHTFQLGFIPYEEDNCITNKDFSEENQTGEEIFNEVINDLISIDILKIAERENFSILGESDRNSTYEYYFPLVKPFYEKFKDDIKEFYITGNFKTFYKNIPKREFFKLIDVVSRANEYINITAEDELLDIGNFVKESSSILEKMISKKRSI